ncbi:endonuclease III domain-containing protein [endosymbiont of Ridgeia piscesae]|jgi:endonuclease-3 related protein|uniref:DNA-3-methyladenine glycosylase III n=1 Tax=endosymbiont of Ridgeia piscesae TaxID=54398 RepID=A0A0T5YZL2_9GAMM|nr:endonuclease III domain-containing protein [endosymbiont of Ridgeia piscesae]KRT56058.1 DNA-3-methyladenine glycosylase III [endosymbiont of Ridgeia piscesae]KRT57244.1 DNA-3-methyladenine glycosylase III [endosymbiont of Ridgeia piscesae]
MATLKESPLKLDGRRLRTAYSQLLQRYGPQHWWPADSAFEVMVGAVLTQNTAWSNVERAIQNLKAIEALDLHQIDRMPPDELAQLIRPAGYFNVKARRLKHLCSFLRAHAGQLQPLSDKALRRAFLSVNGIGPETADDILLYAFERPVFVIDAYTRRIFSRLGMVPAHSAYEALRLAFERALGPDPELFNEYHALIVRHAKEACRKQPDCTVCCLALECDWAVQQHALA